MPEQTGTLLDTCGPLDASQGFTLFIYLFTGSALVIKCPVELKEQHGGTFCIHSSPKSHTEEDEIRLSIRVKSSIHCFQGFLMEDVKERGATFAGMR